MVYSTRPKPPHQLSQTTASFNQTITEFLNKIAVGVRALYEDINILQVRVLGSHYFYLIISIGSHSIFAGTMDMLLLLLPTPLRIFCAIFWTCVGYVECVLMQSRLTGRVFIWREGHWRISRPVGGHVRSNGGGSGENGAGEVETSTIRVCL